MDTGRTAFILIYCLLFITNKSSATEEPNASAKPGQTAATTSNPLGNSPGTSNTTNPSGGSGFSPTAVEAKVGSTSAPLATSPPENKSASSTTQSPPGTSASSATQSPAGKSASASPAIQNPPGKSASASPTTQKTPEGSTLPPAEGGRSASGSKATPTLPEESAKPSPPTGIPKSGKSAGKLAVPVDPKATQPAKLSPPAGIPKSGKSDDNITNETGKMHGSAGEPSTPKPDTPDNKKYFWILLPVGVAFLAVAMYFRYKFFKVHHHPETTDNGTENASFQRTESNRDGVTLLGVKSSGTEEGAAA